MYKLFIGKETYLSLQEAKKEIENIRKTENLEYIPVDGEKVKANDLVDIISSPSLFSSKRILFLKRIYRNKEKDYILTFLLEHLQKNSIDHIIIWEDQKISSVTKYVKFFKSKNLLQEYSELNKRTFLTWAKDKAKDRSLNIDSYCLSLLSQYSNYNPERFENNLKKLKLTEKEIITEEDIKEFSADTLEQDIWKLLDEINNQQGSPLLLMDKLFKQGIDPNYIIAMIARNIRIIAMTKDLLKNNTPYQQLASILRVPPFTLKPIVDASNRYSEEKIKNIYEKLTSLDYEIKVGRIEPKLGLTLLCTIL